jgi:hypothetical protein
MPRRSNTKKAEPHRDTKDDDFKFVVERLDQIEAERKEFEFEAQQDELYYEQRAPAVVRPPTPVPSPASPEEVREAIEQAKHHKNVGKLALMILPLLVDGKTALNPSITSLPAEAWGLLYAYAVGWRKQGYKRGRPPESEEERRDRTKTHNAVKLAHDIKDILRDRYPGDRTKWRWARVIEFASRISGVAEKTIAGYLDRPKGDPRRLS